MFKNILFAFCLSFLSINASGQQSAAAVDPVSGKTAATDLLAEIPLDAEENVYRKIQNVTLRSKGQQVSLAELYRQQPLIIAQVFTRCSGICTPYIIQLQESLWQLNTNKNYKILVFSFDPRDREEDMAALAGRYQLQNDTNWIFATTDQISELTRSIGFRSQWDSARMQYEHGAMLTGVNREGIIKKKIIGMKDVRALNSLINEINNGFEPSFPLPGKSSFLSCFNYDPDTGKSKPGIGLLLIFLPFALTVLVVLSMGLIVRRQ